ncbi:putative pectinesterase inhibitor domain-containing protein [Medicago truncatula]|uniref:Plant invertase/pectin methylesterase inhibitor protein n=1 Tax=Medicago truncatula TaxID=3880 RepID=A0A072UIF7_MEDTR|nr:plant invertase/pectin methylesterase inhibitor protein [Medicago truncatula]RHN59868.1 putative pectinesterase inhibitor domain-containing protein [Medicago truncatula]
MAPSTNLSLLLTISMIFISHAISRTSSPNLYKSVCKEIGKEPYEQPCLKLLETYPQITSAIDYLTFSRLFLRIVAIDNATKVQHKVKEMTKKYPSSQAIKGCNIHYDVIVDELTGALDEDKIYISLDVVYAFDALEKCSLVNEKIFNISSISTMNSEMELILAIISSAANHVL